MTSYDQQRRSWYMFFFQTPFADVALAHDDFAFIERLWRDWSPGWRYPAEEMAALKETFRQPGRRGGGPRLLSRHVQPGAAGSRRSRRSRDA